MWDSGLHPGTSPSLYSSFQSRTELQIQGEDAHQQVTGKSGNCLCLSKGFQRPASHSFPPSSSARELSPVYKTRKPLGFGVLCFPNDLPQLHPCAQTIASGTSSPGWLEELQCTQPVPAQTEAGSGGPVRTLGPAQTFAFHKPTWQQPRPSHYAVFFQFGVSWSGLCSCPAGSQNPAWKALYRSGTQETFQVTLRIGPFPPGGFLLGEASPGFGALHPASGLLLISPRELPALASNTPWLNRDSFVKFLRLEGAARGASSEW